MRGTWNDPRYLNWAKVGCLEEGRGTKKDLSSYLWNGQKICWYENIHQNVPSVKLRIFRWRKLCTCKIRLERCKIIIIVFFFLIWLESTHQVFVRKPWAAEKTVSLFLFTASLATNTRMGIMSELRVLWVTHRSHIFPSRYCTHNQTFCSLTKPLNITMVGNITVNGPLYTFEWYQNILFFFFSFFKDKDTQIC